MARAERIAAEAAMMDQGYEAPEDERGVTDSIEEAFDLVMGTQDGAYVMPGDEGPTADGEPGDYGDPFQGMLAAMEEEETGRGRPQAAPMAEAGVSFGEHEATIGADSAIEDAFGGAAVPFGLEAEDTLNLSGGAEVEAARESLKRRASVTAERPAKRPSKGAAARKKLRALTQPNARDAGSFDQAAEALLGALDPVGWDPGAGDPFRDPRAGLPPEQAHGDLAVSFEPDGDADRQVTEILNLERLKK